MNYTIKILSLTLLVSSAAIIADATTSVSPLLSFRSQGQDLARQKVGTIGHEYKADIEEHNFVVALTPEYTRSFNNKHITNSLFGCHYMNCYSLNVTGSSVAARPTTDLLANWFYLPSNYEGTISFDPVVQNFNADLSFYWGMDKWVKGMFFRVHSPLTWTKFDLGASFKTTVSGTSPQSNVTLLGDAESFFCSNGVATKTDSTYNALSCARFCGCNCDCDDSKTKTRLADVQADLGWNFLLDQDYNLGLFARVVVPTGNKPHGEFLFEPIVGNGGHWELGGGLTGSAILWRNAEENKHFGFYVDANVTHLFNAHQNRVFDLKNKPLSRYMTASHDTTFAPIANLTSCKMDVYAAVQADVTAMFNYTCNKWSCDLGYNFWARSCEKFDCDDCNDCDDCDDCDDCCGACVIKNGNTDEWSIASDATINTLGVAAATKITDDMIDYDGARTKGISHKVFGHINYTWSDNEDYVPFLGLGGFAEFGHHDSCGDCCCDDCNDSCSTNCDDCDCCKNVAMSQWGVWLKGGVSF